MSNPFVNFLTMFINAAVTNGLISKEQGEQLSGALSTFDGDLPDNPTDGEDVVTIGNSFKTLSGDDQQIELDELKYQIERFNNKYTTQADKAALAPIVNMFVGKDGKINEELFKKIAGEDGKISEEEILALDTNKDGQISQEEIEAFEKGSTPPSSNTPITLEEPPVNPDTPPVEEPETPTPPATPPVEEPETPTPPATPPVEEPETPTPPATPPAEEPETPTPPATPNLDSSFDRISNGDGKLTKEELQFRLGMYQSGKLSEAEMAELKPLMDILLDSNGKIDEKLFSKLAGKSGEITLDQIKALDADKNGEISTQEIADFKNPPVTDKDIEKALQSGVIKTITANADKFDEMLKDAPAAVIQNAKIKSASDSITRFRDLVAKANGAATTDELNGYLAQITRMAATISQAVITLKEAIDLEKSKEATKPVGNFDDDFMNDIECNLDAKFTSTTNVASGKYDKKKNGQVNAYTTTVNNAMSQIKQMNDQTIVAALKTQFNYDALSAEEKKVVDQKIDMITKAAMFETLAKMMGDNDLFTETGGKGKYQYEFKPAELTEEYLKNIQKFAKQSGKPETLYKVYNDSIAHFKPYMNMLTSTGAVKDLLAEAREGAASKEKRFPDFFAQNDKVNPMFKQYDSYADGQESTLQGYEELIRTAQQVISSGRSNIQPGNDFGSKMHEMYSGISKARGLISKIKSADTTAEKQALYEELTKLMEELRTKSYEFEKYRYTNMSPWVNNNNGYSTYNY